MVTRCSTAAPNRAMDWSCSDYVLALEEERKKIKVFQRELPLCMKLVTQAIERLRQQMDDRPVLEEFIPLKPSPSSSLTEERIRRDAQMSTPAAGTRLSEKLDWLKSVQLWNQNAETEAAEPPPPPPVKPIAVSANGGGAFHPFVTENKIAAPASSDASKEDACVVAGADGGGEDKKEGQPQAHRKTRRSWSPALHRRFLHALEQLGGSHVATPKQIKELMKVDGLTNDEVKSHLQKTQDICRRLLRHQITKIHYHSINIDYTTGGKALTTKELKTSIMSGMWVQPQDSTAVPAPTPVAALASDLRFKQQKQNKTQARGNGDGASNSSSSETTTALPSFTKNMRTYR